MSAVGIIPARFASSRFPGKPLALVGGVPMLRRVWEGARNAERLREVIVATDDERIAAVCEKFGASVAMTRSDHPTGSDRLAEVAAGLKDDVVVNIQGDEPLIAGALIDAVVDALLADEHTPMATAAHESEPEAIDDPNRVKVVLDANGFALYFSRAPIPFARSSSPPRYWQHVGVYAYRRRFLLDFVDLPQTPAEKAEALEQLRALEHGYRIRVADAGRWRSVPVDVPEDVQKVEAILEREGNR